MQWLRSCIPYFRELRDIHHTLECLMSALSDLNDKVTALQAALDAEQADIMAAIGALEQTIADLRAQLGGMANDADLEAVIERLEDVRVDLTGTVANAPPPPAES